MHFDKAGGERQLIMCPIKATGIIARGTTKRIKAICHDCRILYSPKAAVLRRPKSTRLYQLFPKRVKRMPSMTRTNITTIREPYVIWWPMTSTFHFFLRERVPALQKHIVQPGEYRWIKRHIVPHPRVKHYTKYPCRIHYTTRGVSSFMIRKT